MSPSILFRGFILLICISACQEHSTEKNVGSKTKPNIVFIFTDDQTYTSIAALGNDEIITPNMDRLVNKGVTFTHAYNMGAWHGAVCVASRAMLMSGRSVWRAKEFAENRDEGDTSYIDQTWGKLMEKNGYETYMAGKWHINMPVERVFQNTGQIRGGMPPHRWNHQKMMASFDSLDLLGKDYSEMKWPAGYNRPRDENDQTWSPSDTTFGGYWSGGKHWSEVLKDDAVQFIQRAQKKENPFFMYLAFNAPHDHRQVSKKYIDMYPLENIKLPESFQPEYPDKKEIGCGPRLRDEALAPFPRTPYAVKKHIQEYYALMTHLDEQIGVILDSIETIGKMDNTFIIFTSDHGLAVGRHGLMGKQNLYDHSVRVPFIIVGPGIPKGIQLDQDVYLQDAMATTLDIAGIEKPDYVEFNSLLQSAQGNSNTKPSEAIYGAYMDLQRSIRKDHYKLIIYPKAEKILLFDLKNDPEELNDISNNTANKKILSELIISFKETQKEMGDELELEDLLDKF